MNTLKARMLFNNSYHNLMGIDNDVFPNNHGQDFRGDGYENQMCIRMNKNDVYDGNSILKYDGTQGKLPLSNKCSSVSDFWPASLAVNHFQGVSVSADGGKMVITQSATARIDIVDLSDQSTILASNTNPFGDAMFSGLGLDHPGDPKIAWDSVTESEVVIVPCEDGWSPGEDIYCCIYNASTLAFIRAFPLTEVENGTDEACSLTVRDGIIYTASYNTQTQWWKYDFNGVYQGTLQINMDSKSSLGHIQGFDWIPEYEVFIAACGTPDNGRYYIVVDKDGDLVGSFIDAADVGSGTIEGLCWDATNKCIWIAREPSGLNRIYEVSIPETGLNSGIAIQFYLRRHMPQGDPAGGNDAFFAIRDSLDPVNVRMSLCFRRNDNALAKHLGLWSSFGGWAIDETFEPAVGQWNDYRFTFRAFEGFKIFVDGNLIQHQDSVTSLDQEHYDELWIGEAPWLAVEYAPVDISDVRIFSSSKGMLPRKEVFGMANSNCMNGF